MNKVSKWEVAGVPAALTFGAAHRLGLFESMGITAEQLPDVMLMAFIAVAAIRLGGQWWLAQKNKK